MKYILYNAKEEEIKKIKNENNLENILIISNKQLFNGELKYHRIKSRFWLQELSYKKIQNKTIKELFKYYNQTIFYLLNYSLLRELFLFKGTPGINLTLTLIDMIEDFVDEDVSVISYDSHKPHFIKLLRKICKKRKVNLEIIRDENKGVGKLEFLRSNVLIIGYLIKFRIFLVYLIGLFRKMINKKDKNSSKILFLSNIRFYRKKDEENIMFGNIMKELKKRKIKYTTLTYDLSSDVEYMKEFISKFINTPMKYIGDYYSIGNFFENHKLFKKYGKIWKSIKYSEDFKKSLEYKGINIYDLCVPVFDLTFNALIYLIVDNLNISKKIIMEEKPKLIILDHENNFYGKGMLINTKNSNIKSLALQHEAVLLKNTNHAHIKDKKALNKNSVFWRPVPTKKCVAGSYAKRILLKIGNYTEDSLEITGDPKLDDIFNKKINAKEVLRKYELSKTSKKILFGGRYKEDAEVFIEVAKSFPNIDFLIKPHPSTKINFYKHKIKECGSDNLKLINKSSNIHELLTISDILICKRSTIGIEALAKKIPLIVLNTNKDSDPWDYVSSGSAVLATNTKELQKRIVNIIEGKVYDWSKVNKYLKDRIYKTDGKSSERIVNIIESLIK